ELINHALEGRSEQEQQEEEQRFKKETGESISSRLYGSGGWFGGGELSGDDAHRAKEIQAGSAGTDKAAFQQAFLQFQHQAVEGTGFIAEGTMAGSPEKRNLYKSRDQLARMLMQAAGRPNGDPSKVFGADGKILPPYTEAFDKNGKLRRAVDPKTGKPVGRVADLNAVRSSMHLATTAVKTNADAYRAAIDRQEAFWTNLITALAIVVSIALMFIPGVNLLVAGIIVAVLAGAATMAVKAGFRGGRYGWEEAATDVGMTAIEAATAGIGGGMGRGAAAAEKAAMRGATLTAKEVSGTLAKVGAGLSNKLGRVGGAIAREAIVGAVGGAARTALNERTWKEGFGAGLEEMALGGLKGAAVSAVSAGVSQGIASKLNKSLAPALDPTKAGVGARVGEKLGEGGRQMLSSIASQTLGAMAATATDIIIDSARGRYEGGLKDALRAIGETGLRELFSSAGRTGAELRNKARYRALMAEARKMPPGSLTERDLKTLKLAAISAGEHHEAITEEEVRVGQAAKARGETGGDPMLQRMKAEVDAGQKELAGMPKALQDQLAGMDAFELRKLRAVITNPAGGTSQQRLEAYHGLLKEGARLEPREFLQMVDQARPGVVAHEEGLAAQRKQVRGALSVHLEDSAKGALKGLELEDLAQLPPEHVQAAGKMIASGTYDERAGAELFLAARAKSPALTEKEFTARLKGAVDAVTTTRKMEKEAVQARREAVLGPKKDEAHAALSGLDDDGIKVVKHLMDSGAEGSPLLKEALYQQAA
ncbi:MAG TPA: hypothetical protein VFB81_03380, partial [Myxococcales bacterium]|nr:hypothetical protein [Myxococcales bacterium]